MPRKIIKIDRKARTKEKLIKAVGKVLSKEGFSGLGINKVAKAAGVDKVLVYRYFGGLPQLVRAFSETVDFWPTVEELQGPYPERLQQMPPDKQVAEFFKAYITAIRKRPLTLDVLAWELLTRNELTRQFEDIRIKTILLYFDELEAIPDDDNLTAIVVLMGGAVNHLILQSRFSSTVGGIDLESEKGWQRINDGIDLLLKGIFDR
jgi:AcrR family transcriptional regulator